MKVFLWGSTFDYGLLIGSGAAFAITAFLIYKPLTKDHNLKPWTPFFLAALGFVFGVLAYIASGVVPNGDAYAPPPPDSIYLGNLGGGSGAPNADVSYYSPPPSPVEKLLGQTLELTKGKIAFDVPSTMKQGQPQKIEVRIAKGADKDFEISFQRNLSKAARTDDVYVAPFMIVQLSGPRFDIVHLTQEKQVVTDPGYTAWAWIVTPTESGEQTLYLSVGTRFRLPLQGEEVEFGPLYEREVSVQVDRVYVSKRFVGTHWQWLTVTILMPFLGFIIRRITPKPKKPHETVLLP